MLTLRQIQEAPEKVIRLLKIKNFDSENIVNEIIHLDNTRKSTQAGLDSGLAEMNNVSRQIGFLIKSGKTAEANEAKQKTTALKEETRLLGQTLTDIEKKIHELLVRLPNLPHIDILPGKSAQDNTEIRAGGELPKPCAGALPHWELMKKLDIISLELGTKITGSGFPLYKGKGAILQRALINFFLDEAIAAGYREYIPPLLVNSDSAFATGQLPDKDGQMYHVETDDLFLIPTSEVPLTNIFRDTILDASDLPVRLTAYSPCFRREAGSYGKDVRGLNRIHQFDKVEIVHIEHPEKSYNALENMVSHVEALLKKLELPYRIMKLCGGDLSFTSAFTYDFEVYSAVQEKWLEVSSVSNFETFQANRLKLRFRDETGKKTRLVHTLNGSALALPRIVAALIENNQTPEGIKIPQCIVSYTGFEQI
ncbi:MAG: serine--tRNA ligase [Bacteroidetes bacterium]|nr:serine--tRNA ligase [Bacteroidota bacterium]